MSIGKYILYLAGLFILAAINTGCRPGIENVDPSDQAVTFWYQHSGEREKNMKEMIADFNDSNEWGITVEGEYAGSYDEIYNKIVQGIPVGQLPELAVAYSNQAAVYAKMGGIIELSPYIKSPKWGFSQAELDDFFTFIEQGDYLPEYKGRYGFPNQRSMEVLYYNEDWLRQLGYDQPPSTWDEFEEMACAASDQETGKYGYVLSVDPSTFADMLYNRGGSLTNEDGTSFTFGDQAGVDVLAFLNKLHDKGCLIIESDEHEDQEHFSEGKTLFTFSSTSGLSEYTRLISEGGNFNWSVAPLPSSSDSVHVLVYGASLSILRTTPEKQLAAWLFIKWLTETEQTAYWAQTTGYFPVRHSAAGQLEEYFSENPAYGKAFNFLDLELVVEPGMSSWTECRRSIGVMFESAALGGDPGTLMKTTLDACNQYLEDFSQGKALNLPQPGRGLFFARP